MTNLNKEKMYVLGPLEIAPNQFAVGERSYAAIKGNMPYYNELRQRYYMDGNKEIGDAIGELDTRAQTAEAALEAMTAKHKFAKSRIDALTEEIKELKKEHESELKRIAKEKKKTSNESL